MVVMIDFFKSITQNRKKVITLFHTHRVILHKAWNFGLYGKIFDWCRKVYICWSCVDLDIVKLKTLREHLTVDWKAPDVEFEQMTTLFIQLALLNFYQDPFVEFWDAVPKVLAVHAWAILFFFANGSKNSKMLWFLLVKVSDTLRRLLLELDVCSPCVELQDQEILHIEAVPAMFCNNCDT